MARFIYSGHDEQHVLDDDAEETSAARDTLCGAFTVPPIVLDDVTAEPLPDVPSCVPCFDRLRTGP